jgi:trans-aconitate methyltransferase
MNSSRKITYLEGDLRTENWDSGMKHKAYDVVYSTTALHWLPEPALRSTYAETVLILKRGGLLINGNHMRSVKSSLRLEKLYRLIKENISRGNSNCKNVMGWDQWSNEFKSTGLRPELFEERERRLETGNLDQKVPLENTSNFLRELDI